MSIKDKYSFSSRDDFFSFYIYKSYIKRKIELYEKQNPTPNVNEEIKIRNRSTKNKIITNNNYNFSLEHILLCQSICRKKCKLEDYTFRKIPTPIEGLNCDKIDNFLFASQRLTNRVINKFDLINKLKELNVGLIVNCEMKGEHPLCGDTYKDNLDICGFAYSVSLLEKNGIDVLLCGWKDLKIPESFAHLIKIIKKMYYYINKLNKKIIVHCHAGFGRTAIVLACYNIFTKKINAEKARELIRKGGRSQCLGSNIQFIYCKEFAEYMKIIRANFYEKNKKDIIIFKINERMLDIGEFKFKYFAENKYIEYVPIFLIHIFERIIQIKNENKFDESKIYNSILNNQDINEEEKKEIEKIINEINNYNWQIINKCDNLRLLGYLLFKWLNNSIKYVLNPKDFLKINDSNYVSNFENYKECTKTIIDCICRFLSLLKDNKNSSKFEEFLEKISSALLGYALKDNSNEQENNICLDNLRKLIRYNIKNN